MSPIAPPLTTSLPELMENGSDQTFRTMVFSMVRAAGHLQTCRDAFARAMGLTGSQFAVLVGTAHCQGQTGVSIRDLAAHVHVASTHVTTDVGRLLSRGLLFKRPNPDDGRSVLVSLSPAGEKIVSDVAPLVRAVNDQLFAGLTKAELVVLNRVFARFSDSGERALATIRMVKGETD